MPAAVVEMLLRSEEERFILLSALPEELQDKGSFIGLRAKGGFIVDAEWSHGGPPQFHMLQVLLNLPLPL